MNKILLFDGNSIINRAFYAMPPLTNKEGLYTNAVYGFMSMFYKFIDEEKPGCVGVCFDLSAHTFRHERFAGYKGARRKTPDELRPQIPLLKELLTALDVPVYQLEGYEADDILGTLAKEAQDKGNEAVIVSGDKDLLQMASGRIKIKIPRTRAGKTEVTEYYEADVIAEYGVSPKQYIDVKALMGDASDNIPGVSGIGEKTALKIIAEHKTLENAIENAAALKPKKAGERLLLEKETALLSKELATIITDAPVALNSKRYDGAITDDGMRFLERLEFNSILSRIKKSSEKPREEMRRFEIVSDIKGFVKELMDKAVVSYSIFEHNGAINAVSFCYEDCSGYLVEISAPFQEGDILELLKPFFECDGVKKIAADAKGSFKTLKSMGISVSNVVFDVSLAGYVLDPTKQSYNYDKLAMEYLFETHASAEETLGKGKSKISVLELEPEKRTYYCANTANVIYRLYAVMDANISEKGQSRLFYEIESPLTHVLFDMEQNGIKVDKPTLTEYGRNLSEKIETLTSSIYELTGKSFNINSPKQLGEVLFEDLGLTSVKKTKTGYSTSIEELERLKGDHPVISEIIEYRSYTKLKSTYVDGLLSAIDGETGKLHTTFNQTVAATGRLSSTEPNLQNIPVRIALGRELRKAFVPDSDEYVFTDGDYSQIELRVLAHISQDKALIEAFKSGKDIHRLTASQVNNMPYELITPGQRSAAKAVNFGIIYGISAFSLSVDLGISKWEADKYIKAYFEAYPNIKAYLDNSIASAKSNGFAETIFGRRRPMPELLSSNYNIRAFGERVAMNMPIQGAAADIIKIAMLNVYNALKERGLKSRMILQVHDELLVLTHKSEALEVKELLEKGMRGAAELLVPLDVDIHVGDTWYDAK